MFKTKKEAELHPVPHALANGADLTLCKMRIDDMIRRIEQLEQLSNANNTENTINETKGGYDGWYNPPE